MNKKKILFSSIIIIIIAIFVCSSNIVNLNSVNNVFAESTQPTLSITSKNVSGDKFIPDSYSNTIYIDFTLSEPANSDVTIKFHAQDKTAIAEAGDYYYKNGSVSSKSDGKDLASASHTISSITIAKGETNTTIAYYTSKQSYVTKVDGVDLANEFVFCIDSIENCKYEGNLQFDCRLNYYSSIDTYVSGSTRMLIPYKYYWEFSINTDEFDGNKHLYGDLMNGTSQEGYSPSQLYDMIVGNNLGYIYSGWYASKIKGWAYNVNRFDIDIYTRYNNTLISSSTWDHFRSESGNCDQIVNVDNYRWSSSDSRCMMQWPKNDGYGYYLHLYNNSAIDRYANIEVRTAFRDIDKASILGCYLDDTSCLSNGKLRLGVRFSEPVQVLNNNLAIIAQTNNNSVKFHYVGGSYTNTLYFECNINSNDLENGNIRIVNLQLDEFENVENIGDMGKNKSYTINQFVKSDKAKLLSGYSITCDIDLRTPKISYNNQDTRDITYSKNIEVYISNMFEGELYYNWSTSKIASDDVNDYSGYIQLENSNSDQRVVTIPGQNMYGEYYLHIYVKSGYGRTNKFVMGRTDKDNNSYGGYLFDNVAPNVTDLSVAIDTLKYRTISLSSNEGNSIYDSGIYGLYISVATKSDYSDATSKLIWMYDSSVNLTGYRNIVYQIPLSSKFVYTKLQSGVTTISSQNYGNSTNPASFSSKQAALEYIKFNEYQDLELVIIDADQASALNNTSATNYIKASGEDANAVAGQAWIRYKKSNWSYLDEDDKTSWVYYLYSTENSVTKIDINNLSNNLISAINNVSQTIVNTGSEINLIETGCVIDNLPALELDQIHCEETVSVTKSNSQLAENLTYSDENMLFSISGGSLTYLIMADESSLVNLADDQYGTFYIGFYVIDRAGNSSKDSIDYYTYEFDRRDTFDASFTVVDNDSVEVDSIDDNVLAYDIGSNPIIMQFKAVKDSEPGIIGIDNIYYQGSVLTSEQYEEYFDVVTGISSGRQLNVIPKQAGYYTIEINLVYNSTTKYHTAYNFYITDNKQDNTTNYIVANGNNVLNNNVFQVSIPYYYMNSDGTICKKTYGDTNSPATFSTKSVAVEYIRFMEYQDLQLVKLNSYMASALNSSGGGDKNYIKAKDETQVARVNQMWIKYKSKSWTTNCTESDWVYYYYGDEGNDKIVISQLKLAGTALNDVVTYITSTSTISYTKNLVYGEDLDSNCAPYLQQAQIHVDSQSCSCTLTGASFDTPIVYNGDSDIYVNTLNNRFSGNVPIVTNVKINIKEHTRLFYAFFDNSVSQDLLKFKELDVEDGTMYKDAINGATGTYVIREYDDLGISEYIVYIDKNAPVINVSYVTAVTSKNTELVLQENANGAVYSAKSFIISSIDTVNEYDSLAYLTIYDKKAGDFIGTYYSSTLEDSSVILTDGNYEVYVGDRSGNLYSFTVQVSSEELQVTHQIVNNSYLSISCNREKDQISRFDITCDGVDLKLKWEGETIKLYEAGFYTIYVLDIYGFDYEEKGSSGKGYQFERELPQVVWYYVVDGQPYEYNENNTTVMNIYESFTGTYYINTSKRLKFYMNYDYNVSVTGIDSSLVQISQSGYVTINSDDNWDLEISYPEYPEVKIVYHCVVDNSPPSINVAYESNIYQNSEMDNLQNQASTAKLGDVYTPQNLTYKVIDTDSQYVKDGSTIDSSMLELSVDDSSGVKIVEVYINNVLFKKYEPTDGKFENVILSRLGEYNIIATDSFGNKAYFTFTNSKDNPVSYSIDGETQENYTNEEMYGNSEVLLSVKKDCEVFLLITDKDNKQYFEYYTISNGKIIVTRYLCVETEFVGTYEFASTKNTIQVIDSSENVTTVDDAIFDINDITYIKGYWYQIKTKLNEDNLVLDGYNMFISHDGEGNISFKFVCDENYMHIESRVNFSANSEPFYFNTILSKELTDITLRYDTEHCIETNKLNSIIYINKEFYIDTNIDEFVNEISISYSDRRDFIDYTIIYSSLEGTSIKSFDTKQNGFYSIRITNKYGNTLEYILNHSDKYEIITIANYNDGTYSRFTSNFQDVVKANKSVQFEAYASSATFTLTKDNVSSPIGVKFIDGCYYLEVIGEGNYDLMSVDNYGNEVHKLFEIKNTTLVYDEDLIYGYNEKAVLKDEGYTNYLLSIKNSLLDSNDIKYVSIIFNNEENVIYNKLNEFTVDCNDNDFVKCIGTLGSGEYTVVFRDSYGSVAKKLIHYSNESTLSVSRKIRSSLDAEQVSLEDVENNGVWANHQIFIESSSIKYKFTIDNTESYCPKTFEFSNPQGDGGFNYVVYYIDEYGFEYNFEVHLLRRQISLEYSNSIITQEIDDVTTTRNNISLSFDSDTTCEYQFNNNDLVSYTANTLLYRDGVYRFTCQDLAGNITSKTIKKDTICEFEFVESSEARSLVNGDVANSEKVTFEVLNNDTAYIKTIYLDGVKQQNNETKTFQEHGKWNIIVADEVGNETMFEFYLITHKVDEFTYTTPNSYIIKEFWYTGADNMSVDYLSYVTVLNDNNNCMFTATENGQYTVVMQSSTFNRGMSFVFTVDNTPPKATIEGCEEGEKTIEDIKVSGCEEGDTVYIYRNGTLLSTTVITAGVSTVPEITEGGTYKVVVVNEAGVSKEMNFERTYIPNVAGSVLIMIAGFAVVIGIIIGMVIRNKTKFDD